MQPFHRPLATARAPIQQRTSSIIISFTRNYIYVRTRKTGSSTIESIQRSHAGPNDLIVKESFETLCPVLKPGVALPDDEGLTTHLQAAVVRPLIRDGLFKFTSERHPYERAVSFAYYRVRQMGRKKRVKAPERDRDFPDLLDHIVRRGKYATFPYYTIDGRPVVDDFVKLESLQADMHRICTRLGMPPPDEMPWRRETARDDKRPAREVLTPEQRDIVYEHCRPEFDLLGYER